MKTYNKSLNGLLMYSLIFSKKAQSFPLTNEHCGFISAGAGVNSLLGGYFRLQINTYLVLQWVYIKDYVHKKIIFYELGS